MPVIVPATTGTETMPSGATGTGRRLQQASGVVGLGLVWWRQHQCAGLLRALRVWQYGIQGFKQCEQMSGRTDLACTAFLCPLPSQVELPAVAAPLAESMVGRRLHQVRMQGSSAR